ncbi:MAG TPA: dephospho-CoA kinase [Firmicutes bacterium]|jgi:dephospho-CoA kinase|nr:dephospho-CoA kinase [Bacillota bacterium]
MCKSNRWHHLYVLGLTGGIATGKSTVSRHLRRLGAYVIDADKVAHQVTMPGTPGYLKVVERFGGEVVTPEGALDRKALGRIVFGDREALSALNSIVHPLVIEETHNMLDGLDRCFAGRGARACVVLDVPLLFEAGIDRICDEIWVVAVDLELQIKRLRERDGYSREEALSRIRSQMPLEEKTACADVVIDNSGSIEHTQRIVSSLWHELNRRLER